MMRLLRLLLCCSLLLDLQAQAHEFWLRPQSFSPKAGSTEHLQLWVGEYYTGDLIGFEASHATALDVFSRSGKQALYAGFPHGRAWGDFPLPLGAAGAYVAAFDSTPLFITMPAEKFHAYLHDEGLDFIVKQREAAGAAALPGRERFRRNVKTLMTVGGKSDASFGVVTGQRLEIVPLTDPAGKHPNEVLQFKLLFDGQPLEHGLVKVWQKQGRAPQEQLTMIRVISDADGKFSLLLPNPGVWMLSVVQMIPAEDTNEADWDSYWSSLTFALPARR